MNDKPKVRIPVSEVPWASGTIADLECWRRLSREFSPGCDDYHPTCCRWPKSCGAYDPGFATGKGPTEVPVVWNDGHGWRSGPPSDLDALPEPLAEEIRGRWADVSAAREIAPSCGGAR